MRTLKINLLYECTAQCAHCRFSCTNDGPAHSPDVETPYAVAKELKENLGLDMAVVLGGEPTLYRKETIGLLERLHGLGLATRMETNAGWAESPEAAVRLLAPLKELETSVMLSLDGFHDPFVPVERVGNAILACERLGLTYNLEQPYLDVEHRDHPVDRRTEELYRSLSALLGREIRRFEGGIVFVGRAADSYGDAFAAGRGIPRDVCTAVPWWLDGEISTTDLLILEPGGYLTKGCGIAIGNVHEKNVTDLVKGYDPYRHPIFSVLLTEGPLGLAKLAERVGYRMKRDYADKCQLCQEARRALRPYYEAYLQPEQYYGSGREAAI